VLPPSARPGVCPVAIAASAAREPSRDDLDVVQSGDLRTTPLDPVADRDADDLVDDQAGRETREGARLAEEETGYDVGPDRTEPGDHAPEDRRPQ